MSVKETQDVAGFGFQKTGAQGQAPQSQTSVNANVVGPPSLTVKWTPSGQSTRTVNQNDNVTISGVPQMPQMTAQLFDSTGRAVPGTVFYQLSVDFDYLLQQPCGAPIYQTRFTSGFVGPPAPIDSSTPWDLSTAFQQIGIRGGIATLSWNYASAQASTTQQTGSFTFNVLGSNPSTSALRSQIAVSNGLWFMERITQHETHGRQFCPLGTGLDSSPYCNYSFDNLAPPSVQGTAIFGCPGGYGLFQLDPSGGPNPYLPLNQLWDWTANTSAAITKVASNGGIGNWNVSWQALDLWNTANPSSPAFFPDERIEGPYCHFSFARSTPDTSSCSGSSQCVTWFADAISMKRNAGIRLGPTDIFMDHSGTMIYLWDYIRLDNSQPPNAPGSVTPEWVVKTTTGYVDAQGVPRQINSNIVLDFCNSVIP